MTLSDISNQIIDVLVKEEKFTEKDFSKIKIEGGFDFENERENLIKTALKDIEGFGFVSKISSQLWILNAPIGSGGQEISISLSCANMLAEAINPYLEVNEIEHRVNKLSISEEDIWALLEINNELLDME